MKKLVLLLMVLAVLGILAYPLGLLIDQTAGAEYVRLETVFDDDTVELNRAIFDDDGLDADERRTAVIEIYGNNPSGQSERYLFVDESRVVVPVEDPSLSLLKTAGSEDNPLQSQSVLYLSGQASIASLVGLALLGMLYRFVLAKPD